MKASEAMRRVIGIDLGDRYSYVHELDMQTGETMSQTRLPTKPEAFGKHFASIPRARITLEVGAHSPWSSRLLQSLGHQVVVANPRTLALIHSSNRKRDELDAEKLARLARLDPKLLSPIRHRELGPLGPGFARSRVFKLTPTGRDSKSGKRWYVRERLLSSIPGTCLRLLEFSCPSAPQPASISACSSTCRRV